MADAFLGLLALCGLGLLTMAVLGFDQRAYARVLDAVVGIGMLGGAGYLAISVFEMKRPYWLAVLAPVPLVVLVLRERRRRRRRLAAGLIPHMYVAPPPPTPLTPFPAPPPPLGAAPGLPPETPQRASYQPLPSGLPRKPGPSLPGLTGHQPAPRPDTAPPWHRDQPAPAPGTPGPETLRHAADLPAGHDTAAAHETTSRLRRPAYLEQQPRPPSGGRHRAADTTPPGPAAQPWPGPAGEQEPPEEWPPYRP